MNVKKYIGMYVHQETISIAVMTGDGKLVMESIIETKASTILHGRTCFCPLGGSSLGPGRNGSSN
jgi:hypothetical protein